jgi:hypothetical protein
VEQTSISHTYPPIRTKQVRTFATSTVWVIGVLLVEDAVPEEAAAEVVEVTVAVCEVVSWDETKAAASKLYKASGSPPCAMTRIEWESMLSTFATAKHDAAQAS